MELPEVRRSHRIDGIGKQRDNAEANDGLRLFGADFLKTDWLTPASRNHSFLAKSPDASKLMSVSIQEIQKAIEFIYKTTGGDSSIVSLYSVLGSTTQREHFLNNDVNHTIA